MDLLKEEGLVVRLPLLNGTNYSYWKARMHAFIKSMDELAWKATLTSGSPPTKENESSKRSAQERN